MIKLKPGDPCPCCGQPIKTTDPLQLEILTLIANDSRFRRVVQAATGEALLDEGDGT